MIICTRCGYHNENADAFCGSCGSFLEWTGEKPQEVSVEPTVAEPPPVQPLATAPPRPGFVARVRETIGLQDNTRPAAPSAPEVAAPPSVTLQGRPLHPSPVQGAPGSAVLASAALPATPPPPPVASIMPSPTSAPSAPPVPTPGEEHESALRALSAEVPAATTPAAAMPRAQKPRVPLAPKPGPARALEPPTRRLQQGDLICGECGERNDPARKFCSRCGSSLVDAVEVHIPWYRRIFRRRTKRVAAGDRPARMRGDATARSPRVGVGLIIKWGRRVVVVALAALVVLLVVVPGARAGVQNWFGELKRQLIPSYTQVHAINSRSTGQTTGHGALSAIDGNTETWWGANWTSASHPVIDFTFASPVELGRLIVYSGEPAPAFGAHARPRGLHLIFSDGSTIDVSLADLPTNQTVDIGAHTATSVTVEVVSIYPGVANASDIALREVEFYARQ